MLTKPTLRADLVQLDDGTRRLVTPDGSSFVVPDEPCVVRAIRMLDGNHSWAAVNAVFADKDHAAQFGAWMSLHGLLDSASPRPLAGRRIRLHGADGVGAALAPLLLGLGASKLWVHDATPVERPRWRIATRADELVASLSPAHDSRVRADPHWSVGSEAPDLSIVAGPGVEADRAVLADLHRAGVPALVVSAHHDLARVGPLHVARHTPCWRCTDLATAESDPAWPRVVAELSGLPARPDPLVAAWATHHALLQAVTFLTSGSADLAGAVHCWNGNQPGLRVRILAAHPRCLCG